MVHVPGPGGVAIIVDVPDPSLELRVARDVVVWLVVDPSELLEEVCYGFP